MSITSLTKYTLVEPNVFNIIKVDYYLNWAVAYKSAFYMTATLFV